MAKKATKKTAKADTKKTAKKGAKAATTVAKRGPSEATLALAKKAATAAGKKGLSLVAIQEKLGKDVTLGVARRAVLAAIESGSMVKKGDSPRTTTYAKA